jgi:integrase
MVEGFLDAISTVKKLALRTQDRYRAALDRFLDFCQGARVVAVDAVDLATVEDFVRWLRGQKRNRNGAKTGSRDFYKVGGVKFVLSTCRTAFNWEARRRMLPPFADNPFRVFPIDQLKEPGEAAEKAKVFTPKQEQAFFTACSDWQRSIFATLATYGLRLGELTHLLVEDVDLEAGIFTVCSKPWMFWSVKTGRERWLPLLPETRTLFEQAIGGRKAGFVFLNEEYASGRSRPAATFATPAGFQGRIEQVVADLLAVSPDADERARKRAVVAFCRSMGQIPEKRVRNEFLKLTSKIGCPEFTRAHDLRHLFSTRAQAAGINPLLVQEMLGHASLNMTKRYSHPDMATKREALLRMTGSQSAVDQSPQPGKIS